MTEREEAIKKIIKIFQIIDKGLDKGISITPKSEQHMAIKVLVAVWRRLEQREKEQ